MPPKDTKKYSFDSVHAVTQVGDLSTEKVSQLGGPLRHAHMLQERAVDEERKRQSLATSPEKADDSKARRRAQNRRAASSSSKGRKAQTKALEELNSAICVQKHSLKRVEDELDKQLSHAKTKLELLRCLRGSRSEQQPK